MVKSTPRTHIPGKIRLQVKSRYDGHCGYCGAKPERLQVDHIKPFVHGGGDNPSNLMPACFGCNNYKMNFDLEQFRREIAAQVRRARDYSLNFRLAEKFGLVAATEKPVVFYFEKIDPHAERANVNSETVKE